MKVLVVGAGFAGATVARELAEAGHKVTVIDRRDHIGGNAYDFVNEHGIRVHRYGPHIWHTSNDEVQEWVSRFTQWTPYQHWVRAQLDDEVTVPLPVNHETIEEVFDIEFEDWLENNPQWYSWGISSDENTRRGAHAAFLETKLTKHDPVTNSRQHVENSVGVELCDLFFAPYTKKMWGLELEQLPASVAARIPTNVESGSYLYFPKDKHQYMPLNGYTAIFESIFDHPNIKVVLNTDRERLLSETLSVYWQSKLGSDFFNGTFDHIFTAEPIDEFFKCDLGPLPWRSIKLHTVSLPLPMALPSPVMNFTHDGPHTRVTEWKKFPAHGHNDFWTTLTFEEPCDYRDNNMERYYPVKTALEVDPNRELYKAYRAKAEALPNVTFIGRCGQYAYLDMHQAISSALHEVRRFLKESA